MLKDLNSDVQFKKKENMKIGKMQEWGMSMIQEVDVLSEEMKKDGFRELVDTECTLQEEENKLIEAFYEKEADRYVLKYRYVIDESVILHDIDIAQRKLNDTDYIITKFSEGNMRLQMDIPEYEKEAIREDLARYDLDAITGERETMREDIRRLRAMLDNPEII